MISAKMINAFEKSITNKTTGIKTVYFTQKFTGFYFSDDIVALCNIYTAQGDYFTNTSYDSLRVSLAANDNIKTLEDFSKEVLRIFNSRS